MSAIYSISWEKGDDVGGTIDRKLVFGKHISICIKMHSPW